MARPKSKEPPAPATVNTYGFALPESVKGKRRPWDAETRRYLQFYFDQKAFSKCLKGPDIPPRHFLFQRIADTWAPGWFEWHPWTIKLIKALCDNRYVGLAGCTNAAKTWNLANFAAVWWLCDPLHSSVIFCSTTMGSLRKRGWAFIQRFYQKIGGDYGNFVDSRTLWQADKGNDLNAIFCKAVCDGDAQRAAADIQGIHTARQLVIVDEAEAAPAAIWIAVKNLANYPIDVGGEFILAASANPRSRLSQFGRFMEPDGGWQSVTLDTDDWIGKPQSDGARVFCIRFDFCKTPNITEGRQVSKHLPSKHRVELKMANLKESGAENNPDFWCYERAFPPPEGLLRTVFTETLIEKYDGYGKHKFTGRDFRIIGALDPAYGGGDRPALRFGALGQIEGGKMGIELIAPIILSVDLAIKTPIRYQLVEQLKRHCQSVNYRGQIVACDPSDFAIDCTGDAGVADIACQEWSPRINRILFSAAASEDPCSAEDQRPANQVYLNKRVEMYYRSRNAMIAGQLKGMDQDTATELCTIEEIIEKNDGTVVQRVSLMNKKKYKEKYQKSPDFGDVTAMVVEVGRLKGFTIAGIGFSVMFDNPIEQHVRLADAVYTDMQCSEDNLFDDDGELASAI